MANYAQYVAVDAAWVQ